MIGKWSEILFVMKAVSNMDDLGVGPPVCTPWAGDWGKSGPGPRVLLYPLGWSWGKSGPGPCVPLGLEVGEIRAGSLSEVGKMAPSTFDPFDLGGGGGTPASYEPLPAPSGHTDSHTFDTYIWGEGALILD
jgi:hypothetical protein